MRRADGVEEEKIGFSMMKQLSWCYVVMGWLCIQVDCILQFQQPLIISPIPPNAGGQGSFEGDPSHMSIQIQYQVNIRKQLRQNMKQQSQLSVDENEESVSPSSPNLQDNNEAPPQDSKRKHKKKKTHNTLVANLIDTQYSVVKKVVHAMLGFKVIRDAGVDDWDLYWTDNAVTSEQLAKMKPYQKINHFPGMYTLSRKNYLARNLIKMQKKFPNDYNFFPKTWVLPSEINECRNFMESDLNAVVIAKPQASSQGRGIFLTKSFEDFEYGQHYVVQKYLKKPFLIDGLKFDLRVYVLVAGCDPLRVYIYKQGLARFATEPYCAPKKQNLNNLFMHLTNYAINKNSGKFQFNSSATQMNKGHKRSLTAILMKLEQLGHSRERVWEKIKDCIAKTIISAQPLLAHHYRSSQPNNYANNICFEILGFDVILDHNLKPEVLEVNYTPSFTTDTPLDLQIKKNLIHDALVLMNLTAKAKNQIIYEKKKEMKERTLTGKNFHHTRQARQSMVDRAQKMRNIWESKHLGNYQRILPVIVEIPEKVSIKLEKHNHSDVEIEYSQEQQKNQQDCHLDKIQSEPEPEPEPKAYMSPDASQLVEKCKKYDAFLEYSIECYQNHTGANIRRNTKILPQNSSQAQGLLSNQENTGNINTNNTIVSVNKPGTYTNNSQAVKYTNTENLEKIYKSKFKPMIYRRNNQSGPKKIKQEENNPDANMKSAAQGKGEKEQRQPKPRNLNNPYLSTFLGNSRLHAKHKSSNPSNYGNANKRAHSINRQEGPQKQEVGKNNHRTASSFKKGLSTVYNITFQDKRSELRPN